MKKVLCATDHSEIAQKAETFAAYWAKNFQADLVYAYVSRLTEKDLGPKAGVSSVDILKDVVLQEHKVLAHAKEVAEEAGIPDAQCVLLRSRKIAHALVDYAKKEGVEQIIVGSGSRAGFARLTLGSIAAQIVGGAHCPVTVIR
jgi:nucleotide-binding universal stress UspA family protein